MFQQLTPSCFQKVEKSVSPLFLVVMNLLCQINSQFQCSGGLCQFEIVEGMFPKFVALTPNCHQTLWRERPVLERQNCGNVCAAKVGDLHMLGGQLQALGFPEAGCLDGRSAVIQANKQTDRQTDKQTNRLTD